LLFATEHLQHCEKCNTFTEAQICEVCLDEEDRVWFMLHSGSRGVGNAIGSYFIERLTLVSL